MKGTPAVPKQLAAVKPKLSRARTGVLVLNGNGRQGAAASESARLHTSATRARDGERQAPNYANTVVMYRRGFAGEACGLPTTCT